MKPAPSWDVEGRDWPNRAASSFVRAGGLMWHVQIAGDGPAVVLIHGTGAGTHTWRGLLPLLAQSCKVVAMDLPGHAFTEKPERSHLALPHMAKAVSSLLAEIGVKPRHMVGHSAGAAVALRMTLDGAVAPERIVSLNGAFRPFNGLAAILFPVMARLLALNPFAAPFLAWRASTPSAVSRLIAGTGSVLDAAATDYYARLLRTERHVAATLAMMAYWDLTPLLRDLRKLKSTLVLVANANDRAVPPREAGMTARLVEDSRVVKLEWGGHLAHEEKPAFFSDLLVRELAL